MFNVITGLRRADARAGSCIDDEDVTGVSPHKRARKGLARTFQRLELFSMLTVRENIRVAADIRRRWSKDSDDMAALTESIIERVGLTDVADPGSRRSPPGRPAWSSSARALACKPPVLLLDEPASGQDDTETERFGQLLVELAAEGTAVVLVEHDMSLVMEVCHHVHVLDLGRMHRRRRTARGAARPGRARRLPRRQQAAGGVVSAVPAEDIEVEPILELRGLRAGYDGVEVLHGVDLVVHPGRVVALLGPNGAGKSTTLLVVAGLLGATGGDVLMAGRRVNGARPEDLARFGLCLIPEGRGIFPNLTGAREPLDDDPPAAAP